MGIGETHEAKGMPYCGPDGRGPAGWLSERSRVAYGSYACDSPPEDDLTQLRSVEGERDRDDSSDGDGDLRPMLMLCGE